MGNVIAMQVDGKERSRRIEGGVFSTQSSALQNNPSSVQLVSRNSGAPGNRSTWSKTLVGDGVPISQSGRPLVCLLKDDSNAL